MKKLGQNLTSSIVGIKYYVLYNERFCTRFFTPLEAEIGAFSAFLFELKYHFRHYYGLRHLSDFGAKIAANLSSSTIRRDSIVEPGGTGGTCAFGGTRSWWN